MKFLKRSIFFVSLLVSPLAFSSSSASREKGLQKDSFGKKSKFRQSHTKESYLDHHISLANKGEHQAVIEVLRETLSSIRDLKEDIRSSLSKGLSKEAEEIAFTRACLKSSFLKKMINKQKNLVIILFHSLKKLENVDPLVERGVTPLLVASMRACLEDGETAHTVTRRHAVMGLENIQTDASDKVLKMDYKRTGNFKKALGHPKGISRQLVLYPVYKRSPIPSKARITNKEEKIKRPSRPAGLKKETETETTKIHGKNILKKVRMGGIVGAKMGASAELRIKKKPSSDKT